LSAPTDNHPRAVWNGRHAARFEDSIFRNVM